MDQLPWSASNACVLAVCTKTCALTVGARAEITRSCAKGSHASEGSALPRGPNIIPKHLAKTCCRRDIYGGSKGAVTPSDIFGLVEEGEWTTRPHYLPVVK